MNDIIITLDDIILRLEKYLELYEIILFFPSVTKEYRELIKSLVDFIDRNKFEKKCILMITDRKELYDELLNQGIVDIEIITHQESDYIMEIYKMYEFSNRITVIADNNNYPSIFNYLRLGVLTENECFEALFR